MQTFRDFWTFSAIRGVLTVLAACAILFVPHFAAAILTVPVLVTLGMDVLALYLALDAGALLLLAICLPAGSAGRKALLAQSAASVAIAGTLFLLTYIGFTPLLLMGVVAAEAAVAALVEYNVGRQTHRQYGCLSCYATAFALTACALALPFASGLDTAGKLVVLAGFAGLYGVSQLSVGARMLFLEYRASHPAPILDETWRAEMNNPLAGIPGRVEVHYASLGEYAAAPISRSYVVPGQGARMIATQQHAA